jgi:hypothetical protein
MLVFLVLVLVNVLVTTLVVQTGGSPDFVPADVVMNPAPVGSEFFAQEKQSLPDYFRSEEQTVLTIPEWYLVYNPLEYADFLAAGSHPSDFPFYQSIDEYWSLYDKSVITSAGYGVENDDYMLMLQVIGVSTTVEYLYKGLYENTMGRFSRWTAGGVDTEEDRIIAAAHRAYSDLLVDEVWYVFDFSHWIDEIWANTDLFGENFIRKTERKLFFSLEFGFKSFYAGLIESAAKATAEEESSGLIYMEAILPQGREIEFPDNISLIMRDGQRVLLSSPRWGGFTRSIPLLLAEGVVLDNVSGNDKIAVSYLASQDHHSDLHAENQADRLGDYLFDSRIVTAPQLVREVVLVELRDLGQFLDNLKQSGARLEHIYDY